MCRRGRKLRKFSRITLATAMLAGGQAFGQVDATWVGPVAFSHDPLFASQPGPVTVLNQGHDWTDVTRWSAAAFPTAGGRAEIMQPGLGAIPASDRAARLVVTLDQSITLRELEMSNPGGFDLTDTQPAANAWLLTADGGLTLRATRQPAEAPSGFSVNRLGNNLNVPVGGLGGVTVTGGAVVTLGRHGDFAGALAITDGILAVTNQTSGADYDARLGTHGGPMTLTRGTLRLTQFGSSGAPVATLNRGMHLASDGTINLSSSAGWSLNGAVSGPGSLQVDGESVTFSAASPMTGAVRFRAASVTLSGSMSSAASVDAVGSLTLYRGAGTLPLLNHLGDDASLDLRGATLTLKSVDAAPFSETVGTVTLRAGGSSLRSTGWSASTTLDAASLQRAERTGLFIDAPGLGTGVTSIVFGNSAALLRGGDVVPLATSAPVVPWMWASTGGVVGGPVSHGAGRGSLVTSGPTGLRPLDLVTGYVQSIAAAGSTQNVRVTSNQSISNPGRTINALLIGSSTNLDTGNPSTISGGTLTIQTGAVLNTTRGNTVFNPLQFGAAEAVIISASTAGPAGDQGLSLWGALHGSGGLTKLGPGNMFLGGASTLTGTVTVAGGRLTVIDNVLPNVAGPLGQSNDPVVLLAGGTLPGATENGSQPRLSNGQAGGSLTIARPVIIRGETHARALGAIIDNAGDGGVLNLAGLLSLESTEAPLGVTRGTVIFAGGIVGPGRIRDWGNATLRFAGANPGWTGGLEVGLNDTTRGIIELAAPGALGTGPVFVGGGARSTISQSPGGGPVSNAITFAPAGGGSVLTFEGAVTLAGPVDFGTNIGRPIAVPAGSSVAIVGGAQNGSMRLLAGDFGAGQISGGTLTLAAPTMLDGRIFIGDAGGTAFAATAGGTLRVTDSAGLGSAGVQIDAPGSMLQLDGSSANLTLSPRTVLLRHNGVASLGALHNAGGHNTLGGNVVVLEDASIGVAGGTSLRVLGDVTDWQAKLGEPATSRLSKTGLGVLSVSRLARLNLETGTYRTDRAADNALAGVSVEAGTLRLSTDAAVDRNLVVSVLQSLSISPGATLDVARASVVIDYDVVDPASQLVAWVDSGFAGGSWGGTGITSALAAADASRRLGVGVVRATEISGDASREFAGQKLDDSSVVVTLALYGDANVDGRVNIDDFGTLAARFNLAGGWAQGDFDYNHAVNIDDFAALARNFNTSFDVVSQQVGTRAVPEPAGLAWLLCGARMARRRQNAAQPGKTH